MSDSKTRAEIASVERRNFLRLAGSGSFLAGNGQIWPGFGR